MSLFIARPFSGESFSGVCSFTRVPSFFPQPGRVSVSASGAWVRAVVDSPNLHAVFSPPASSAAGYPPRSDYVKVISPPHTLVPGICWSPWMKVTLSIAGDQSMAAGRAFLFLLFTFYHFYDYFAHTIFTSLFYFLFLMFSFPKHALI